MAKRKTVQVTAGEEKTESSKPLTWAQERFIEAYVFNGGNAAQAYQKAHPGCAPSSANSNAHRMMINDDILHGIEAKRARVALDADYTIEEHLRILQGIVRAKQSDFAKVLLDVTNKDNFVGLGDLEYAITGAERTVRYDKEGNETVTNSIRLASKGEALRDVERILGLKKKTDSGRGGAVIGRVGNAITKLLKPKAV